MRKIKLLVLFLAPLLILIIVSCKTGVKDNKGKEEPTLDKKRATFEITTKDGKKIFFSMIKIDFADNITLGKEGESQNPPHTLSLSPYYIGEMEVTQELYQEIMGENPSEFKALTEEQLKGEVQALHPVEQVSIYEAFAFCNALTKRVAGIDSDYVYYSNAEFTKWYTLKDAQNKNKKGELEPKPVFVNWQKKGFRIPTEAEWEWAARGGSSFKYAGSDDLAEVGWYDDGKTEDRHTHQVALKRPNAHGLYDMSGNVYEWCWDLYTGKEDIEEGKNYALDPKGNTKGWYRTVRGGCHYLNARACEVIFRNYNRPYPSNNMLGIRLVKN